MCVGTLAGTAGGTPLTPGSCCMSARRFLLLGALAEAPRELQLGLELLDPGRGLRVLNPRETLARPPRA